MNFVQGYRQVMNNCMESARILRKGLEDTGRFDIISKEQGVPLVVFSFKDKNKALTFKLSKNLHRFGWIVPAYTLPADVEHMTVLRAVVREDFGRPLAEKFLSHLRIALNELDSVIQVPIPTIRYTMELRPGDHVEDDGTLPLPNVVIIKQEVEPADKSIQLTGGKTKGVC